MKYKSLQFSVIVCDSALILFLIPVIRDQVQRLKSLIFSPIFANKNIYASKP